MGRKRLQATPAESAVAAAHAAEADRKIVRLERELRQLLAVERLEQIHSGAVDFLFDVEADTMRYRMPGADEHEEIAAFQSCLREWNAGDTETVDKLLRVFSANGPRSGGIEATVRLWKAESHLYRLVYERIDDSEGVTVVGFAEDISDEAAARELLKSDADRDALTGLYTQDTLLKLAAFEVAALAPGEKAVMFCFDMDRFGEFNTAHGRPAGDSCLRAIAAALKTEFRGVDLLARIESDEFAVFFRGFLAIDVIERRAQRLLDTVHHLQTELTESASCSMGIAVTGSPREDCAKLLEHAQKALSVVKKYGGNRYRIFDNDRY